MTRIALNYFCIYTMLAVLAPYLQLFLKAGGFSPSRIGILLGTYNLAGILGAILLGRLADRHRRVKVQLAVTLAVFLGAFLLIYLFPNIFIVFAGLIVMGFFFKSMMPLTDAFTLQALPDPDHDYGRVRVMGSISFFSISLFFQLTGLISGDSQGSIISWVAGFAVLYLASLLVLPRKPSSKTPAHTQDTASHEIPSEEPAEIDPSSAIGSDETAAPRTGAIRSFPLVFWLGLALIFLGRAALTAHYSFFSVYLQEQFGLTTVSGMWAIGPMVEIPMIFFSGYLIRRFGLVAMFAAAFAAISVRLLIYAVSPGLGALVGAQLLHSLTFGVFHTAGIAFVRRTSPNDGKSTAVALYSAIGGGAASFAGSSAAGFIVDAYGFTTLFLSYACLPVIALLLLPVLRKLMKGREIILSAGPK